MKRFSFILIAIVAFICCAPTSANAGILKRLGRGLFGSKEDHRAAKQDKPMTYTADITVTKPVEATIKVKGQLDGGNGVKVQLSKCKNGKCSR